MADPMQPPENDPDRRAERLHAMLTDIVGYARRDIGEIAEPKAQALFETTAEVCTGLAAAYEHYELRKPAWR